MAVDLTLEQRAQTLGPASFGVLLPQFEQVKLISEIQSERLTNDALRHQDFFAGNGVGYDFDDILYLTDFPNNPIVKDPKSAAEALRDNNYFFINPAVARDLKAKAAASNGVVKINLRSESIRRHMRRYNHYYCYISVSTAKLAEGREAFRQEYGNEVTALFDSVHGSAIYGGKGIGALMLEKNPRNSSTITVHTGRHITTVLNLKYREGTMLGGFSFVKDFDGGSAISLCNLSNGGDPMYMRGTVKQTAEGVAPQKL